jgi:hypothetical protein
MRTLTRRAAFGSASAALLAGCASTVTQTSAQSGIQTAINDANLIIGSTTPAPGTGLEGAYAQFKIANPTAIPAVVDMQVQEAFAEAPSYLAALQQAANASTTAIGANLSGVMSSASQVLNLVEPYIAKLVGAGANPVTLVAMLAFQAAATLIQNMQPVVAQISPIKVGAPKVAPIFVNPDLTPAVARTRLVLGTRAA